MLSLDCDGYRLKQKYAWPHHFVSIFVKTQGATNSRETRITIETTEKRELDQTALVLMGMVKLLDRVSGPLDSCISHFGGTCVPPKHCRSWNNFSGI